MKRFFCFIIFISSAFAAEAQRVIAHRGSSGAAPENTPAAFRKAMEEKAWAIELDVRKTKDGFLVVLHDEKINRTTNGNGKIGGLTLAEVKSFDAGSWFSKYFRNERIPTLEEVITLLDSSTIIIIEPKENGLENDIVDLLRKKKIERQVILKSFHKKVLENFKLLVPEIPRLYVYAFHIPWLNIIIGRGIEVGSVFDAHAEYLQPHRMFLTTSFVREAHGRGKKIIAWGVDSEDEMNEAIHFGVDAIETDYPGRAYQILNR